ncbi:TetR/AcrR family transcriptional regulator C-terminal domain-containing protein [Nonomuraea sp. NBC_01738]|uniref:TetR/AcrR family transcriptional regulator n=1 Tax=Nonomuraea sp. NBC_01738 TaxID=2976003 RepID=UPI002E15384C|nr:TetR/AcrR family transcriptional regulator C-terminal domain-containing protein [Nonomuraea sp. NBC_01738]
MTSEPLSRKRIVAAAIELIEREGADAVSMRRIAAELGVGVMSLYNHVPNKDALLSGVAESVLSEIEFTDDPAAHWTDRVRIQARAFRQIAHHYPRSTMLVVSRQLHSNAGLLPVERALATLRSAGFDGPEAVKMLRMFIAFIVGTLLREVGVTPSFAPMPATLRADQVDPELFPTVAELAPMLDRCDPDEEFDFGVELLVQAISVHRERAPGEPDALPGSAAPSPERLG